MSELEHADSVRALIQRGRAKEAIDRHNEHLRQELDRAVAGQMINLSDLAAAKEILEQNPRGGS